MAVTLAAETDAPGPRVEILADGAPGSNLMLIERTYDGHTEAVRGAKNAPTTWPTLVVDYEAPIGVEVTYTVHALDAVGAVLSTETAQTTVPPTHADPSWVWIHDPYVPAQMMCLPMEGGSLSELAMARDLTLARLLDSRETVAVGGALSRPASLPWSVFTERAETSAFEAMVADAVVLAVRSVAPVPLRRVVHLAAAEVVAIPIDARYGDPRGMWQWVMPQTQVRAPSASLVLAVHTWQEVIDTYPTWNDVMANKATWGDVLRDPRPGV